MAWRDGPLATSGAVTFVTVAQDNSGREVAAVPWYEITGQSGKRHKAGREEPGNL